MGSPAPPRNRSPAAQRGGACPRGSPQDAGIGHPRGSVPHPSLATGASRRAPRGRGPGAAAGPPRCPVRGGNPGKRSLGVGVPKLLTASRGSGRAAGRPGRSFERVYLRTLPAERARNSRISSEAANICRRERAAEPGRAAGSLPPEPRRRPGRTRPHSEKTEMKPGTCGAGGWGEGRAGGVERQQRPEIGARPRGPGQPVLGEEKSPPIPAPSIFFAALGQ